jgi:hypothetical protein
VITDAPADLEKPPLRFVCDVFVSRLLARTAPSIPGNALPLDQSFLFANFVRDSIGLRLASLPFEHRTMEMFETLKTET